MGQIVVRVIFPGFLDKRSLIRWNPGLATRILAVVVRNRMYFGCISRNTPKITPTFRIDLFEGIGGFRGQILGKFDLWEIRRFRISPLPGYEFRDSTKFISRNRRDSAISLLEK